MQRIFKAIVYRLSIYFFALLPIDKNKAVFSNFGGQGFSGNSKYIAKELARRNKGIKIYWIVDEVGKYKEIPVEYIQIPRNTMRAAYHTETAKVWVDNIRKNHVIKRNNQIYIQGWHGLLGIKKVEGQATDKLSSKYILGAKKDSENLDVIISPCGWYTEIMKKNFWITQSDKIKEFGAPEFDYFHESYSKEVNNIKVNLKLQDKKVLLYAPTFRNDENYDYFALDFKSILEALSKKFGGQWILVIRLHPNVRRNISDNKINCEFIDAALYEDSQELIYIADAMVTDYSSMAFGAAVLEKPCFLYVTDYFQYKEERDFEFSLEELPFDFSENIGELQQSIENYSLEEYKKKINCFFKKIGMKFDGRASIRTVDWLEKYM